MTGTNEENFDKFKKRALMLIVLVLTAVIVSQYMGWLSLHKEGIMTITEDEYYTLQQSNNLSNLPGLPTMGGGTEDTQAIYDDGYNIGKMDGEAEGFNRGFEEGYSKGLSDGSSN